eukprot:Seg2191.4 transcript_id=Seg2191.4/GoldUCD/mRNA.D3Y31 product="Receptor expression-enhancing protein 2" protein_id=Seg2191.4/GoldUCD/D3Y31
MISQLVSRLMILVFGTLYPAYRSYKAVKTKDVREYVKWMMYWIVFAFFTAAENAADCFISWLPLYYEIKIIFLLWLLSPATKGSSILYRKFVHPWLSRHEKDIDKYIENAKENGYVALLRVGRQGLNVATDTFLKTAVTGQTTLINTLRRYSSMQELNRNYDEPDAGQGVNSRLTWHGGAPANQQMDSGQYDFEDDYRVLEQQYHDEAQLYNTLPGAAQFQKNPAYQESIPESHDEADDDAEQVPADTAEDADEDFVDAAQPRVQNERASRQKSNGNNEAPRGNQRTTKMSKADQVSQMRGYSTLPRSRNQRSSATSAQQVQGGTLPRATRRSRPKLQKSNEA